MMTLSQEEKGLPQKISDDIIALILEENLKPGDKLPNETILSQRLDVGRSSLREAMKLLASRNIVTVRQGSGTYIAVCTVKSRICSSCLNRTYPRRRCKHQTARHTKCRNAT